MHARPRLVHLGLGAFFRAFGVPWIEEAGGWDIIGVSLRSSATRDALKPQKWAYTTAELAPERTRTRRISALTDVLVAPEDPSAVISAMANPNTRIVSLTVTEKGYCHDPATGKLSYDHTDILHDIDATLPRSAPGYIVRALAARRDAGEPPFAVLSCDNLPENGRVTRGVVTALAKRIDPALAKWIKAEVPFPSTMIDRIVPATTDDDIAKVSSLIGIHDLAPVMHEPFRQWVIEDDFPNGRPILEAVGVQMVQDVALFETMKLRMLNGTHSAIAYMGYMMGYETVADAVRDTVLADFVRHLWIEEIIPTLEPPEGTDLLVYADALMGRYANPGIRHSTWQIAMDGSQKLPQRLLGTIHDRYKAGCEARGLLVVLAAWIRYVGGTDESGQAIDVRDPMSERLKAAHDNDPAKTVQNILAIEDIFDSSLARQIEPELARIYSGLLKRGAREMAKDVLS